MPPTLGALMVDEEPVEVVRLTVPARPEFARLARLTAARLARRRQFTYREVEDLRMAVDEAMVALLGGPEPDGTVGLVYTLHDDALEIQMVGAVDRSVDALDRFATITADLVDESSLDPDAGEARLLKRHIPLEGERIPASPHPGHEPDARGPIRGV
jgi:serine/threonine-protein kinase RsbW